VQKLTPLLSASKKIKKPFSIHYILPRENEEKNDHKNGRLEKYTVNMKHL